MYCNFLVTASVALTVFGLCNVAAEELGTSEGSEAVGSEACARGNTLLQHTVSHSTLSEDMQTLGGATKTTIGAKQQGNDCSKGIVMPCDCEKTTFNHLICDKRVGDDKSQCSVAAFGCTFAQLCPDYCDSSSTPPTPTPPTPTPAAPTPSTPPSGDPDSWGMPCDTRNDCCSASLCPGFTPPAGDTVSGHRPNCQCSNGCTWGRACGRDAPVAANNYFQPTRHCGERGHCGFGSWTDPQDTTSPRHCLIYNDGRLVREQSPAGYCMGVYEKAYADFLVTVNPRTTEDFEATMQWMMDPANAADADQRSSCTDNSFCLGHGSASGEIGRCQCSSTGSTSIDVIDLDRFSSILESECDDLEYCSDRGTATFSSGTCSCACASGYSGSHCELVDGAACTDFQDCFGHGYSSGIRPNCQCDCNVVGLASTHQFTGARCDNWAWGSDTGVYVHQLSLETAGTCAGWCAQSAKEWTKKCSWSQCEGCSECEASTPTPSPPQVGAVTCAGFCARHAAGWTSKCSWPQCAVCSECR